MTTTGPVTPPQVPPALRPIADADGTAIASLITAILIPPLGIVFGAVHISQAHRKGLQASGLASWGIGLGILLTLGWVIFVIALAAAVSKGTSFQDCVNNAILNGADPSIVCTP